MTPRQFSTAEAWRAEAACIGTDPSVFFPEEASSDAIAPALAICSGCRVRGVCGDYAVNRPALPGVWGGMTEKERCRRRADSGGPAA